MHIRAIQLFFRARPTATGYLLLLIAAEAGYAALPRGDQIALRAWASTNVDNLHAHPIGALLLSGFIPDSDPLAWPVLICLGLFTADRLLGWWRSLVLVVTAHVLGTLLSEGVVWYQVGHGGLPHAALGQDDVGASFVTICALTFALAYGWTGEASLLVRVTRPIAGLAGLIALRNVLVAGLSHLDVAPVGHTTSMVVGAGLGGLLLWRVRTAAGPARRRPDDRAVAGARRLSLPGRATAPGSGTRRNSSAGHQ